LARLANAVAAPDPAAVLPWHLVGGSGNE